MSLNTNRLTGDIVDAVDINQIAAAVNQLSDSGTSGLGLSPDPTYPGYYLIGGGQAGTDYPPVITLGVSADGLTATATWAASDPNGDPISSVSVSWGDGQTTTAATSPATHTYARGSTYTVTATVTAGGKTGTDSVQVTVGSATTPSAYRTAVLADEPLLFMPMDSATNTFADIQGDATPTPVGGHPPAFDTHPLGSILGSVRFVSNSSDGRAYVDLGEPSAIESLDNWTIEWVAEWVLHSTSIDVIGRAPETHEPNWRIRADGNPKPGPTRFWLSNPQVISAATSGTTTGIPTHHAITFDGAALKHYLNGELSGTTTTSNAALPSIPSHSWRFGIRDGAAADNQPRGWFAGLAIYDKALTPTELAAHVAAAGLEA